MIKLNHGLIFFGRYHTKKIIVLAGKFKHIGKQILCTVVGLPSSRSHWVEIIFCLIDFNALAFQQDFFTHFKAAIILHMTFVIGCWDQNINENAFSEKFWTHCEDNLDFKLRHLDRADWSEALNIAPSCLKTNGSVYPQLNKDKYRTKGQFNKLSGKFT